MSSSYTDSLAVVGLVLFIGSIIPALGLWGNSLDVLTSYPAKGRGQGRRFRDKHENLFIEMLGLLAAAAIAGLVGSPHCIGMCGGFAVLCGRRVPDTATWHAGRVTSYAVLGALAGAFGSLVPGPSWVAAVVSLALMVWFSAALAGLLAEPRLVIPGLKKLGSKMAGDPSLLARYSFGVVNGLLPCGLVYAALAVPVAAGTPEWGALAMIAFGVGTVPSLSVIALGVRRVAARDIRVRRAVAAGVLVAGLWSIGLRQGIIGSHGTHGTEQPATEHQIDGDSGR